MSFLAVLLLCLWEKVWALLFSVEGVCWFLYCDFWLGSLVFDALL